MENNIEEPLNDFDFNKYYIKMMNDMNFQVIDEQSDKSLSFGSVPDKWDIAAGLILTGVISISIVGLSTASYYIVLGLYNANILCYIGAIVSASEKSRIINENRDKIMKLIQGELKWLLSENIFYLASSQLKDIHFKLKMFLINHFENETQFVEYLEH